MSADYAPDEKQFAIDVAVFVMRVGKVGDDEASAIATALIHDDDSPLVRLMKPLLGMGPELEAARESLNKIETLARQMADGAEA